VAGAPSVRHPPVGQLKRRKLRDFRKHTLDLLLVLGDLLAVVYHARDITAIPELARCRKYTAVAERGIARRDDMTLPMAVRREHIDGAAIWRVLLM